MSDEKERREAEARNEDPITGQPGSHPVGAGIGAAGGAAAGAAVGAAGGPVGVAVGAVIGGVAGGLAGKAAAEAFDPTVEDAYWRANHPSQPWVDRNLDYEADYAPAYRYGSQEYATRRGSWEDAESQLEKGWDDFKGGSRLKWEQAKDAVQAGWRRVERAISQDADTGDRSHPPADFESTAGDRC